MDSDSEDEDEDLYAVDDKDLPQIPLSEKKQRQEKNRRKKEKEAAKAAREDKKKRKTTDGKDGKDGKSKIVGLNEENEIKIDDTEFDVVAAPRDFNEDTDLLPGQLKDPVHLQKPKTKDELAAVQALGTMMIRKKSRMQLLDSQFNRYNFDDEGLDLPEWFLNEESKNNKPELPVTKELMDQFRSKMREINSRPIRKVAEANARNAKRLQLRMEKVRSQAKALAADTEMSAGAKARNMERILNKAKREGKKTLSYMAVKKGGGATNVTKGKATKGAKSKVVDKRLKCDKKAEARAVKKKRGSKSGKKSRR